MHSDSHQVVAEMSIQISWTLQEGFKPITLEISSDLDNYLTTHNCLTTVDSNSTFDGLRCGLLFPVSGFSTPKQVKNIVHNKVSNLL